MAHTLLVTGGARSGKSGLAEARVRAWPGARTYIATATAVDAEMAARIARHVADRGPGWTTIEEPRDLAGALDRSDGTGPRLIDCLTLWLSHLMIDGVDWRAEAETLCAALGRQRSPVALVSNEVGMDVDPAHPLARAFRDAQGALNQRIAAAVDEVVFVIAGQPLTLKSPATA
jgi:adenosylcobinamide kinase/adenosylcobinamide-phosphate guanylyltransferase